MIDREYLVHHGCAGHLGRFRTSTDLSLARGDSVVIRSQRGMEIGDVLCPTTANRPGLPDPFVGEILRAVGEDDVAAAIRCRDLGQRLFDECTRLIAALELPLAPVDIEVLLDGRQTLLHAIRYSPCDEGALLAILGERHDLIVRLHDLSSEPAVEDEHEESHGCENCGSGGCESCGSDGESRGGCTNCSSGSSQELASYFLELRAQMENRERVSLL